jgi:ribonuclease HI
MEPKAMLEALSQTPLRAYVAMETDSQLNIDILTKSARRWAKNGWRKPDGKQAENVHLIEPLMKMIEQRYVTFRKVHGVFIE